MTTFQLNRTAALGAAEIRLLLRNRTAAITSLFMPVAFGLFFAFTFDPASSGPGLWAVVVAAQLALTFTMGVYVAATTTVVARRQQKVLKRMRTSGLPDTGLLAATVSPTLALAVVHLAIYAVLDAVLGAALVDVLPLVLAVVGGFAVAVAAAFATSIVTASPERAQITTLPLFLVMFAAAFVVPIVPAGTAWQLLALLPGASIGGLAQFAFAGGAWAPGLLGLPAVLPALVGLVVWPVVFALVARRWFRWDPRAG